MFARGAPLRPSNSQPVASQSIPRQEGNPQCTASSPLLAGQENVGQLDPDGFGADQSASLEDRATSMFDEWAREVQRVFSPFGFILDNLPLQKQAMKSCCRAMDRWLCAKYPVRPKPRLE